MWMGGLQGACRGYNGAIKRTYHPIDECLKSGQVSFTPAEVTR